MSPTAGGLIPKKTLGPCRRRRLPALRVPQARRGRLPLRAVPRGSEHRARTETPGCHRRRNDRRVRCPARQGAPREQPRSGHLALERQVEARTLRRLLVAAAGSGAAGYPGMALVADERTPAPPVLIRNPGSPQRSPLIGAAALPLFSAINPAAPRKLRTVDVARYVFGSGMCRPICRRLSDLRDPARLVQKSQTPREVLRAS